MKLKDLISTISLTVEDSQREATSMRNGQFSPSKRSLFEINNRAADEILSEAFLHVSCVKYKVTLDKFLSSLKHFTCF